MQSPFDILADTYDLNFTHSAIGQLQREQVRRSLTLLLKSYPNPINILEINCGTGEDAMELSRAGHIVTATDGSPMMIKKATAKAYQAGVKNICFEVCRFDELHDRFHGYKFDIVISNFGGLNCIDSREMKTLAQQMHSLLQDHGKLFFVIMGRSCVWEMLYFLSKGKPASAFRRKRKSVLFRAGQATMPVFYYSPSHLKKIFKSMYTYCTSAPVGLFIPPSYLERTFENRQRWLNNLARLEKRCSKYAFFSNLADHFCIVFQKKGTL